MIMLFPVLKPFSSSEWPGFLLWHSKLASSNSPSLNIWTFCRAVNSLVLPICLGYSVYCVPLCLVHVVLFFSFLFFSFSPFHPFPFTFLALKHSVKINIGIIYSKKLFLNLQVEVMSFMFALRVPSIYFIFIF